jgi:hypothetical protein
MESQWKLDKDTLVTTLQASTNTKLAAMDTKIDSVIATLNTTVQATIKTHMTTMESKLNDTITELFTKQSGSIVSKVIASVTGDKAPYVTAAGMQNVIDTFMESINQRLDKLTDIPRTSDYISDHEKSPVRKHLKTSLAIQMDTQPSLPLTDSSANAGIAGHKNYSPPCPQRRPTQSN